MHVAVQTARKNRNLKFAAAGAPAASGLSGQKQLCLISVAAVAISLLSGCAHSIAARTSGSGGDVLSQLNAGTLLAGGAVRTGCATNECTTNCSAENSGSTGGIASSLFPSGDGNSFGLISPDTLNQCQSCGSGACGPEGCSACGTGCDNSPLPWVNNCNACETSNNVVTCGITCDVPRELRKVSLPTYLIEPPDILLIEAVSHLRPIHAPILAGETLLVQANRTVPVSKDDPQVAQQFKQINGFYRIGTDGYLDLGPEYGKVLVADQPIPEIRKRVVAHLQRLLTNPQVLVTLAEPDSRQIVAGQHLVRMDGTVGLGIYGSVYVAGKSLEQAKHCIEHYLSQHIHNPEVTVDVLAYNSKFYYVVTDGGGAGEQVYKLPITGNETVLDALASIRGLPTVAAKSKIWIARPAPAGRGVDQVLKVDWNGIVRGGATDTNYQVLPGDRIYVDADKMIRLDTHIAKFTAPLERIVGLVLLSSGTYRLLQGGGGGIGY